MSLKLPQIKWWRDQLTGLRVAGREELVNFQPAWAPQYDERYVRTERPTYVPATSKDQVVAMAMVARKHAQPVGSSGQKLVWLNTWNCWGETTTVEPTANLGSKYPAGNYQFDMLEVVREVFGGETFYTSPLPRGQTSSDTESDGESTAQNEQHSNDRDGDGVPDDEDYCPDFPGTRETNGC